MYASNLRPEFNLNFTTLRTAEFGFLGLRVKTLTQTPFFCGFPPNPGVLFL